MIFNVYHEVSEQIIHYLTHKTTDREISGNMVRCRYKGHELTFLFLKEIDYSNDNAYHIIIKQFAFPSQLHDDPYFFLRDNEEYKKSLELGYPHNVEIEYDLILDNIDLSKKWILLWSFGENMFTRVGYGDWSSSSQIQKLSKLTKNTTFFVDNIPCSTNYGLNDFGIDFNLHTAFTQDIYMWNVTAQIRWAYEFKDIFKRLNPEYQFCLSLRNPKPNRLKFFQLLDSLNNSNIFLSQYDLLFEKNKGRSIPSFPEVTWDWYKSELDKLKNLNWNRVVDIRDDFSNLNIVGNLEASRFEFDYYFRILPKAKVQILDETLSLQSDYKIPQFLSEKTYILALANVPFISTHHYPLDIITKLIFDVPHPYYEEIKSIDTDENKLKEFVQKFSDNFDEMYPPLVEWTNNLHNELVKKINSDNSMLSHIIDNPNH